MVDINIKRYNQMAQLKIKMFNVIKMMKVNVDDKDYKMKYNCEEDDEDAQDKRVERFNYSFESNTQNNVNSSATSRDAIRNLLKEISMIT